MNAHCEASKRYRQRNLEKCRERDRKYREANREKRNAYSRAWRAKLSPSQRNKLYSKICEYKKGWSKERVTIRLCKQEPAPRVISKEEKVANLAALKIEAAMNQFIECQFCERKIRKGSDDYFDGRMTPEGFCCAECDSMGDPYN